MCGCLKKKKKGNKNFAEEEKIVRVDEEAVEAGKPTYVEGEPYRLDDFNPSSEYYSGK